MHLRTFTNSSCGSHRCMATFPASPPHHLSACFPPPSCMRPATPECVALTSVLDTHQIPLKLTLAPSEVVAVTAPPPVYVRKLPRVPNAAHHAVFVLRQCTHSPLYIVQVMVPRLGYLPTIAAQVQQYFQVQLQQ